MVRSNPSSKDQKRDVVMVRAVSVEKKLDLRLVTNSLNGFLASVMPCSHLSRASMALFAEEGNMRAGAMSHISHFGCCFFCLVCCVMQMQ